VRPLAAAEQNIIHSDFRPQQTAGYCKQCNRLVARDSQARCADAGHEEQMISGIIELNPDGSLPFQLPRFNWAAALLPPVWGPAHGAVSGALVLPLIIFTLNALRNALAVPDAATLSFRIALWLITAAIVAGTLGFMYHYGTRGWGIAYNRSSLVNQQVITPAMFAQFVRREQLWTVVSALLLIGFLYLVITFWQG